MKVLKSHITTIVLGLIIITLLVMSYTYFGDGIKNKNSESEASSEKDNFETRLPGSDEKIYASLSEYNKDSVSVYPAIDHETVKLMLDSIVPPEVFYWEFNKTVISSLKERSTNGNMKFENGNYMVELLSAKNNEVEKTVICQGNTVSVQSHNGQSITVADFDAETCTAFLEAGVPEISDFISDEGKNFAYSLHESELGKILYAEFSVEKDGYSQSKNYYISLDFGIVFKADCYENGKPVYSLNTLSLYEIENT